jgi:hypothetical protein
VSDATFLRVNIGQLLRKGDMVPRPCPRFQTHYTADN